MAGNMSNTYAELSTLLATANKHFTGLMCHQSSLLPNQRSCLVSSVLSAPSISASLSLSLTSYAHIQTLQLLLRRGLPLPQSDGVNIGCHGDTVTP